MVIAVTGYEFQKGIEFGGDGIKIALCRVQAAKLAKTQCIQQQRMRKGRFGLMGRSSEKR